MPCRMTHVHANIACRDTTSWRQITVEKKKDYFHSATNCVLANSTLSLRVILRVGSSYAHMCLRCPRVSQRSYSYPSREAWIFHRSCDKPASLYRCLRHLRTSHMVPDLAWEQLAHPSHPASQHNPPLGRQLHCSAECLSWLLSWSAPRKQTSCSVIDIQCHQRCSRVSQAGRYGSKGDSCPAASPAGTQGEMAYCPITSTQLYSNCSQLTKMGA